MSGPVGVHLLAIGLFACLDRVVQRILLTVNRVTALLHHVTRIVAQLRGLLLQVFLALIGLALQHATGFLARFRREKETDTHTDSQSEEKVCESVFIHALSPET